MLRPGAVPYGCWQRAGGRRRVDAARNSAGQSSSQPGSLQILKTSLRGDIPKRNV
jgi:hypothetical protein